MLNQEYQFKTSKIFTTILISLMLMSSIICLIEPFALSMKLVLLLLTCVYGGWILWNTILMRGAFSMSALRFKGDEWFVLTRQQWLPATLRGDSLVTTWVCILRFNIPGQLKPLSCVVWQDAVVGGSYKQLMVCLKMHS
jgi:hypothetical protein